MAEITHLSGFRDWIDLDFVERERTPESAMGLGIQSHVAGLSLSNTVELLGSLGVQRSRKTIHDWVQKADIQPESGKPPNQIAPDETVIRINDQQFWLCAAADSETNELLHVRLFATTTTTLTEFSCANFGKNTMSKLPNFSSTAQNISKLHFPELDSDFRCVATEIGTLSSESF
jgi:putative transposase